MSHAFQDHLLQAGKTLNMASGDLHHYATALATDPDESVEAWIQGKTAGVMWHPERMAQPWWPAEVARLLSN